MLTAQRDLVCKRAPFLNRHPRPYFLLNAHSQIAAAYSTCVSPCISLARRGVTYPRNT